jgi:cytochrome c
VSKGSDYANKVCAVCHSLGKGQPAKIGPNLYGIVGDPHAHMAGFDYSDGLKAIKGPWTYAELNQWLDNPRSVVPGTRMSFAGIDSNQTRADVIDYLHTLSDNPEPLPPVTDGAKK